MEVKRVQMPSALSVNAAPEAREDSSRERRESAARQNSRHGDSKVQKSESEDTARQESAVPTETNPIASETLVNLLPSNSTGFLPLAKNVLRRLATRERLFPTKGRLNKEL